MKKRYIPSCTNNSMLLKQSDSLKNTKKRTHLYSLADAYFVYAVLIIMKKLFKELNENIKGELNIFSTSFSAFTHF
jgi:hypothetical protein